MADVLIVGGGPAGLATALALRRRGASVTVMDARIPPIDKACGEGLMPDSLRDLRGLGVELSAGDGAEFRGIRFVNYAGGFESSVATARFPSLPVGRGVTRTGTHGSRSGLGVSRTTLHARMVEAAQAAGVDLRWGAAVRLEGEIDSGRVLVAGEALQPGWVIGADGLASKVRRWAGLEEGKVVSRRFGFRRHFAVEPWSEFVEVHWGRSGQAYVTPISAKEVCVAGVMRDSHCRLDGLLEEMPELRKRLGGLEGPGRERGSVTTSRRLRRVSSGRIALVGDASGSADAITGEGLGLSFRQAELLADAIATGNLASYERAHSGTLRLAQTMSRVMLWMSGSERLRNRAIGMLGRHTEIFERLLGLHTGAESVGHFARAKGLEVAWRLLAGGGSSLVELEPARAGSKGVE